MLSADGVKALTDLATKAEIKSLNGHEFHVNADKATLLKYPSVQTMDVFSLKQLVSYLKLTASKERKRVVNAVSEIYVQVLADELDDNLDLEIYARADFSKKIETFPFGTQLSQEDFSIQLQTKFVMDDNLEELLKVVSSVKQERVGTSEDDGYSQTASTKAGVVLSNKSNIKNLWKLQTYKTFPEAEQPVIPYILRLHQKSDEMPKFALYNCDGGQWKVNATESVRKYLVEELKGVEGVTVL